MSDKNKNRTVRISVRTNIKSLSILNSIEKYEASVGFTWIELFYYAKQVPVDADKFQGTSLKNQIAFSLTSKISNYIDRAKASDGTYYVRVIIKQQLLPNPKSLERQKKTPQLRSAIDASRKSLEREIRIKPGHFGGSIPCYRSWQQPNAKPRNLVASASYSSISTRQRGGNKETANLTYPIIATTSTLSTSIPTKVPNKLWTIPDRNRNVGQTSNDPTTSIEIIMDEEIGDSRVNVEEGDDNAISPDDSISQVSESVTQMDDIPLKRGLAVSSELKDKILATLAQRTDSAIWTRILADLKEFRSHPKSWKSFSTSCPTLSSILVEILLDLATV